MNHQQVTDHIVNWLNEYVRQSRTKGFVIGVSGGIDSALTSTLCAMTGQPLFCLEMPIHQAESQVSRAREHISWLKSKFKHVSDYCIELTPVFENFKNAVPAEGSDADIQMALANSRARLRMTSLYYVAGLKGLIVAGTGNKVEDFGIGFYTKYGDGGVDISPIADLKKTEVYALARFLGIADSIQKAAPTDGLFGDSRSDEDQIGASYPELEWAMDYIHEWTLSKGSWSLILAEKEDLSERQKEVLSIYWKRNRANQHKMLPIPICIIPQELK
jgi:NAD+ synthase